MLQTIIMFFVVWISCRCHTRLPSCHAPVAVSRPFHRSIVQTPPIPSNSPVKRGATPCAGLIFLRFSPGVFPWPPRRGERVELLENVDERGHTGHPSWRSWERRAFRRSRLPQHHTTDRSLADITSASHHIIKRLLRLLFQGTQG
jgi:hypothetical protein